MTFAISNFWTEALQESDVPQFNPIGGWKSVSESFPGYIEAPLTFDKDLSNSSPDISEVILISAPGAVGKSTFARELAHRTSSVLIDLAEAGPVGENTVSGGLARCHLYNEWQTQTLAIIVDGLDEARIRVTQEAFEAFLRDIAVLSKARNIPTVVLGRTGAIQDAWVCLSDLDVKLSVLELGFFDRDTSVEFAQSQLRILKPESPYRTVENKAIELLVDRIGSATSLDANRFSGYAPVLLAIAKRIDDEDNPSALIAEIERGQQPVTLQEIVNFILDRERRKLRTLTFDDPSLLDRLYDPSEQLGHLASRVYGTPPPTVTGLSPNDWQTYQNALQNWVDDHPFLSGARPSSAVFGAVIAVHSILSDPRSAALEAELRRGAKANPFFSEFYRSELSSATALASFNDDHVAIMPASHVGVLYSSVRAGLSLGDRASLTLYGSEEDDERVLEGDLEISVQRKGAAEPELFGFRVEEDAPIRLGPYLEDVDIQCQYSDVEIGVDGGEAHVVAPVTIQCLRLINQADTWIVEATKEDDPVFLEAEEMSGRHISRVPILRGKVAFNVSWEGSQIHPWTNYSVERSTSADPRLEEGLRRFRKFVISFRSHSKGSLARYRKKIEHERMTKGSGQAILNKLIADEILTLNENMYVLHPDELGAKASATYVDIYRKNFSSGAVEYVAQALKV